MDELEALNDTLLAEEMPESVTTLELLQGYARSVGDLSNMLTTDELTRIGSEVVEDYQSDLSEREDWERIVKDALKKASQEEKRDPKSWPWSDASDVNYPLLTVAALQFAARAYPAIVKGDEAVTCKVVGRDDGVPAVDQNGQPLMQIDGMQVAQTEVGPMAVTPQGLQPLPEGAQPEPVWARKPGAKASRAARVRTYMNTTIFYRMADWEADMDMLLMQLPIVGCAFRKVYYDATTRQHCSALVHALNLVVPMDAKSCKTAIRITEQIPNQYPADIISQVRAGYYRDVDFLVGEEFDEKSRMLLEQHRLIDLDGDGYPEPYIVTVDLESSEVMRIVSNFEEADVITDATGRVIRIERGSFYVKYDFFPHPEGKFYGIGLGHLLRVIGGVIDTAINQMMDAGTAQVAGGGFIASGVRLQGSKRSSSIFFRPGEYKTVDVPGQDLKNGIVERTFPNPSPIMFQILEMMLTAAKDISSVKDVITGEASNNGQVGTTLALIEQGLQVFTAIYKRVYRSLKDEYQLLFDNIGRYGDMETAQDYLDVLDDPDADFMTDFAAADMDIRPVSDPSSVTRMQQLARSNYLMQFIQAPGINPVEVIKRALQAADIEDIDELMIQPQPPQPNPKDLASADKDAAQAENYRAEAQGKALENLANAAILQEAAAAGL